MSIIIHCMIPTDKQIHDLWERYKFPPEKRTHVKFVDKAASFLAKKIIEKIHVTINLRLLHVAALLHDIDKNAKKLLSERHPDACVRILNEEGMEDVAKVVATHPLHAILNSSICPKTWEQKLLFLADKMVKYEIITVDKRFDLWRAENLPDEGRKVLEECYPKVKKLEQEILTIIDILPKDVAILA
jgi:putative nucleotidyltransferase with HDIG domain